LARGSRCGLGWLLGCFFPAGFRPGRQRRVIAGDRLLAAVIVDPVNRMGRKRSQNISPGVLRSKGR
jgi:hypothetical protein